ncbi:GTPase domain-containing protein [Clostridium sp. 'White wine YQ']|uniref:GTPase domain-containing protein n=1 Tax=Clostridium sp. 'White wine YQ' TaxID=3027474 RepID=UPI00236643B1|nr:GTPase domain-containing protein [Clostridium sp. 'White wine YQ']MDD7793824.1 GTPase domain-containing protein [Clostridium sp. 'White wine YQ']
MSRYNQDTQRIAEAIRIATQTAKVHYNYLEKINKRVLEDIEKYLNNRNFDSLYKDIAKYDKKLAHQIKELIRERNSVIEGFQITREQIFDEKLHNLNNFTIMLFGRTMSGKSTTIQAFLGEDLKINGNGTPDWTKDIFEYNWNGIRLVDTPGIEGFDESNFHLANNYMEQADLILMVISDDHIEPSLIEKLAELLKENKPFAVILNVKAGNPKIVLKCPERVIRDEEVEGHVHRIKDYLKKEFSIFQSSQRVSEIPIFPVFMEGAFRSQLALKNSELSIEEIGMHEKLYKCSRFDSVIKYICETVVADAAVIKTRSAYDSFIYRLEEVEDVLRSKVFPLKAQADTLAKKRPRIIKDIRNIKEKLFVDFEIIKEIFDEKIFGVDAFVEKYISEGADGKIHKKYENYLDWENVRKRLLQYQEDSIKAINIYMSTFEEDMGFDLNIVAENVSRNIGYETTIDIGKLNSAKFKKTTAKVIKTVGRTAAGVAPSALLGWSVTNFWNPTGWVALAAGAGVLVAGGVVGYIGSEEVKNIGNDLENSGNRDIQQEKNNTIRELKKDLSKNYQNLKDKNEKWINAVIETTRKKLIDGMDLSLKESDVYINETFSLMNSLSNIRIDVLKKEMEYIFSTIMDDEHIILFNIHRVVRKVGHRLKIGIIPAQDADVDIVKIAIGLDGRYIRKIRKNFGQEIINIVGYKDIWGKWGEKQVVEALGVKSITEERVRIEEKNSRKIVFVKECTRQELGLLYDKKKTNHFLSEALLRCKINFEEVQ